MTTTPRSDDGKFPAWFSQPAILLAIISMAFWCGRLATKLDENVDKDKTDHSRLFQSIKETNNKLDALIDELRRNK